MKRFFAALLACAVVLLSVPVKAAEPAAPAADGYLVSLREPLETEPAGCEALGGSLYYAAGKRDVRRLCRLGEAAFISANDRLTVQDLEETYEPALWNLISVGASAAWHHTDAAGNPDRRGDGVTVAVLDSGVMTDHPDLAGANILEPIVLSSAAGGVDSYHGTFVAGLLAAGVGNALGIDGMVPNVTLLPICITWNGGKTDVKMAVEGIAKAVELGADVITFSIGGTNDNEALRQACEDAAAAGVILVTCAGNYNSASGHSVSTYMYPAAYDCVVTVSACKQSGDSVVFDSDYSYFNSGITVAAPGTGITSLYLDGNTATRTGTSFAAPIVTAMAVMAKQADRSIDTQRFIELLRMSAVDLGDPGFDPCYGYGYVNVPAFLDALDSSLTPAPADPSGGEPIPEEPGSEEPAGGEAGSPPEEPAPAGDGGQEPSIPAEGAGGPAGSAGDDPAAAEPAEEPELPVPDYADVAPDAWYYESVRSISARGIMNGTGDGFFSPDADASRAMLVTILWRLAGQPASEGTLTFEDVPDDAWFTEAVRWAVSEKIVEGYRPELFGAGDPVTREQMAVILYRYAVSLGLPLPETPTDLNGYADGGTASSWALEALCWATAENLLNGTTDGRLLPQAPTSRAQLAAVITRFSDRLLYYRANECS